VSATTAAVYWVLACAGISARWYALAVPVAIFVEPMAGSSRPIIGITDDGVVDDLLQGHDSMRTGCSQRAAAAMASAIFLLAAAASSPGQAGRFDGAVNGSAMPSRPKCPPRIIAKCRKGEKPVCVRFKDQCCLSFRCEKNG
jgi:hypothetical protein